MDELRKLDSEFGENNKTLLKLWAKFLDKKNRLSNLENQLKVGDKIKSFTICKIVDAYAKNYDEKGNSTKCLSKFMFVRSDKGQERVLEVGETNLANAVRIYVWNKFVYAQWSQFEYIKLNESI